MSGVPRRRRGAHLAIIAALATSLASANAGASRTVAGLPIPSGYRASHAALAPGVDVFTLVRPRKTVMHIARVRAAAAANLVPVLSNNALTGSKASTETTSAMCRRVRCLAAINGDFFSRSGEPVGGMIINGEPVRSARSDRPHAVLGADGGMRADTPITIAMSLTVHYPLDLLDIQVHDRIRKVDLGLLNVERRTSAINVYTDKYGPTVRTRDTVQLVLEKVRLRSGIEAPVRIARLHHGGVTAIPRGGAVLSAIGDGAKTLEDLWNDVQGGSASPDASIYTDTHDAIQAIAGKPVLLRAGRVVTGSRSVTTQSVIGWNQAGDVYLVTVDGRRPGYSSGISARDLAATLRWMGVRDAIGLDNGGSTTFVVKSHVANKPSDRLVRRAGRTVVVRFPGSRDRVVRQSVERRVANAIAIVAD